MEGGREGGRGRGREGGREGEREGVSREHQLTANTTWAVLGDIRNVHSQVSLNVL